MRKLVIDNTSALGNHFFYHSTDGISFRLLSARQVGFFCLQP